MQSLMTVLLYMRIDDGGFYEWHEKLDDKFALMKISASNKLEESIDTFKSSKKN